MKLKNIYSCEKCGYQSQKWLGKCPNCDAWNSFYEDVIAKNDDRKAKGLAESPVALTQISANHERIKTGISELDRVLGGGLVEGNVILLSGEPGIGKSTLTLQITGRLADSLESVLYISGEESHFQVGMRAQRLKILNENIKFIGETNFENIIETIEKEKPGLVIVDSIQVVYSNQIPALAGSINQVRLCTEMLVHFAKKTGTPVVIVGHVTKDGNLAGPRILEHLVDTVIFIEGERYQQFRIVRSLKNRFGSTNEVGVFEMTKDGLQEITNPSKIFIEGRKSGSIGSAITATIEGTRPFLIEVQALTNLTSFGYPKRTSSGFDVNRVQLLAAVIQKHLQIDLGNQDIYVNVVGGFKLNEPAMDLAIAMAIISSFTKKPLPPKTVYLGEIGLSGELRPVTQLEKRLQESEKMGFDTVVMAKTSGKIKTTMQLKLFEDLKKLVQTFQHLT